MPQSVFLADKNKYDTALRVMAEVLNVEGSLLKLFNGDFDDVLCWWFSNNFSYGYRKASDFRWDPFWSSFKAVRASRFDYKELNEEWVLGYNVDDPTYKGLEPYIAAGIANWPIVVSARNVPISDELEAKLLPLGFVMRMIEFYLDTPSHPVKDFTSLPKEIRDNLNEWVGALPDAWRGGDTVQECRININKEAKQAAFYWFCTVFASEVAEGQINLLNEYKTVSKGVETLVEKLRTNHTFDAIGDYVLSNNYLMLRGFGSALLNDIAPVAGNADVLVSDAHNFFKRLRTMWSKKYLTTMLKKAGFSDVLEDEFIKELQACIKATFYPIAEAVIAMKLYLIVLTKLAYYLKASEKLQKLEVLP